MKVSMNRLFLGLLCVAALAVAGCRRVDERTFTVDVPQASTAADEQALRAALAVYGGIDAKDPTAIVFDAAKHQLTVRYDSMQLAKKNIEISLAKAGFTANGVTPESVGAKPAKAQ